MDLAKSNADLKNKKETLDSLYKSEQLYTSSPTIFYDKMAGVYSYTAQNLYHLGHYYKAMQYCDTAVK
jgi:hypothetical protein